jgi:predicted dehydrogenase
MINWGIIGCGEIAGKRVAAAIKASKDCCLKAVVRRDSEKAAEFARIHDVEKYYTNVSSMLIEGGINAVYVATPIYLHYEHTILSAEYGKHVLCEKPMAMNADQCRDMVKQCKKNKVLLGVVYYRRLYPKILKLKEMIDGGYIGKPIYARAQFSEAVSIEEIKKKSWMVKPGMSGGGPLMDMGSHMIDLLCFCLGEPKTVIAFTDKINMDYGVEDTASLIIRFRSGCHGVVNSSFCTAKEPQIEVFGTKGRFIMESLEDDDLLFYDNINNIKRFSYPKGVNVNIPIIEDFAEAIKTGGSSRVTGEDGMIASMVIDGAYKSSKIGKGVKLG